MTDKWVTQVAVEQWANPPVPAERITQVAIEHWSTVAYLDPGAAEMDGAASLAVTGTTLFPCVAYMDGAASMAITGAYVHPAGTSMDGVASVAFSSIAVTASAAYLDGQAQVDVRGAMWIGAAAEMGGQASMTVTWPLGAVNGFMDGAASVAFTGATIGPVPIQMSLQDGIIGNQVSPAPIGVYHLGLFQNILAEALPAPSIIFEKALVDNVLLTDSRVVRLVLKLIEIIKLHPNLVTHSQYHYEFDQLINTRPALTPYWNAVLSLVQGINLSQATSEKFTWGRLLHETLKISAIAGGVGTYQKSLAQLFELASTFKVGRTLTMNEGINLSSSLAAASFLKLLQKMLVSSAASPTLYYHLQSIAEIVIEDILGHYHYAAMLLAELFHIQPALSRQYIAGSSMAELINLAPVLKNTLTLKLVGNIQVGAEQLVRMLYQGDELLDGIEITALYVSPSGTTTTWVVNTRTNAVTEYVNYAFRSFAKMGDRYVAAGQDGLYELDGDTDDGASIIADLMSGYLQLNDKKMFGIKGAYVAIRGGGRFYLKLLSGDGREYVYELRAQPNMMTTKVQVGKGISTTYMAFELITEGQDFDLDSLEFIPMIRGRRV